MAKVTRKCGHTTQCGHKLCDQCKACCRCVPGAPRYEVKCAECGSPMVLRRTQKYKWSNGEGRRFWGCSRFPDCKGIHGAHPNGAPLGVPGNKETKLARQAAHIEFDQLIKERFTGRDGAYKWLGLMLGMPESEIKEKCHIGRFDIAMCARVVNICRQYRLKPEPEPFGTTDMFGSDSFL